MEHNLFYDFREAGPGEGMCDLVLDFDVIVVGGGMAGMRAALAAADSASVALITKVHPIRSASASSAGGINGALGPSDDPESYARDTIGGGDYLSDDQPVAILCEEAAETIIDMEHRGAAFYRDAGGRLALRRLGGHAVPRAAHAADWTGILLTQTLWEQLIGSGVTILDEWHVMRIVLEDGAAVGIVALDLRSGGLHSVSGRAVVLATGGGSGVYAVNTSPATNTGDGLAMALQAGLPLRDMEFVQFNPTGLHSTDGLIWNGVAVTEAARAEGSVLVNSAGDRFMEAYAADSRDVAPRDIVSRAVQSEIDEGRGFNGESVHLDSTGIDGETIAASLPHLRRLCIDLQGIDFADAPLQVVPAAHTSVGGIPTDTNGRTEIAGLHAAGECASTGIHGASSLAGNGATEALVFGRRAGLAAAQTAGGAGRVTGALDRAREDEAERISRLMNHPGGESVARLTKDLRATMSEGAGINRTHDGLTRCLDDLAKISDRMADIRIRSQNRRFNLELAGALGLANMVEVAQAIASSALRRTESRGSHHRVDHPDRDDSNMRRHTLAYRENGEIRLDPQEIEAGSAALEKRSY